MLRRLEVLVERLGAVGQVRQHLLEVRPGLLVVEQRADRRLGVVHALLDPADDPLGVVCRAAELADGGGERGIGLAVGHDLVRQRARLVELAREARQVRRHDLRVARGALEPADGVLEVAVERVVGQQPPDVPLAPRDLAGHLLEVAGDLQQVLVVLLGHRHHVAQRDLVADLQHVAVGQDLAARRALVEDHDAVADEPVAAELGQRVVRHEGRGFGVEPHDDLDLGLRRELDPLHRADGHAGEPDLVARLEPPTSAKVALT
ncbi:MAG: hypothetical protein R3F59_24415 [Myxococcota bacterium]